MSYIPTIYLDYTQLQFKEDKLDTALSEETTGPWATACKELRDILKNESYFTYREHKIATLAPELTVYNQAVRDLLYYLEVHYVAIN